MHRADVNRLRPSAFCPASSAAERFDMPALRTAHALLVLGLSLPVANALAASGCADLDSIPIRFDVEWPEVWQRLNAEAGCGQNCHLGASPAGDLDLSVQRFGVLFLVGQPSAQAPALLRVAPGDPAASLLVQKLNCSAPDAGQSMPPGGAVSLELQALIHDWVRRGALGEPVEDPIPRDFIFGARFESTRPW
jgi:hypothetical protein